MKLFLYSINQDSILTYGKRRYSYTHMASRQYTRMGGQLQDSATLPLWESPWHTLTSNSLSSSHLCLDLPSDLFPFTKTLYASLSPIRYTFSAHPIFFTSFTVVVFDQECKHWSVSFSNSCNFFLLKSKHRLEHGVLDTVSEHGTSKYTPQATAVQS